MATKKALQSEILGKEIKFEFDGENYVIPPVEEWDLEIFDAQEADKFATVVRLLLGEEQNATFRKVKRTMKDAADLMEAVYKALEADPKA